MKTTAVVVRHPFCSVALHVYVPRVVDAVGVSEVSDVAAVVANALVGGRGIASKTARGIGVGAVLKASGSVSHRIVLKVWTRDIGRGCGRAAVAVAHQSLNPAARHRAMVCIASSARRQVQCRGREAAVWRPPTRIENALERACGMRFRHGLHAEPSAWGEKRRLR